MKDDIVEFFFWVFFWFMVVGYDEGVFVFGYVSEVCLKFNFIY